MSKISRYALPCRELPELDAWRTQPGIKEKLMRDSGGGERFIYFATDALKHACELGSVHGKLSRLLGQGYAYDQIIQAFAEAWLEDRDVFYLPWRRLVDLWWVRHGVPWLAALISVALVVLYEILSHPDMLLTFAYLMSFLTIPFLALGLLYGMGWKFMLNRLAGPVAVQRASSFSPDLSQSMTESSNTSSTTSPDDCTLRSAKQLKRNIEPFDLQRHAELCLQPAHIYTFAATLTSVPLVGAELEGAVGWYPVVFPANGAIVPMAILGLAGKNRFLDEHQNWRVPVVPAVVRYYPFSMVEIAAEGESGQRLMALALDRNAPHFTTNSNSGTRLVMPGGIPSSFTVQAINYLMQWELNRKRLASTLADLETHDVLVPLETYEEAPRILDRLRIVSMSRVEALDDLTRARWESNGIMKVVHLHLESLKHFKTLVECER